MCRSLKMVCSAIGRCLCCCFVQSKVKVKPKKKSKHNSDDINVIIQETNSETKNKNKSQKIDKFQKTAELQIETKEVIEMKPEMKEKTLSQISDSELMNKIELPNERFEDPIDFLKGQSYEIDTSKKGKLGEGKYGVVYKAYKIADTRKKVLACKVMTIDELIEEKMLRSLRNELYTLQRIRHDNIIELYEHFLIELTQSFPRKMNAYIFMQFADKGSLEGKIKGNEQINDYEVKRYFGQIVNGVSYMHRRFIAHGDLKLDNILLLETNGLINVKVSDFGMSQIAYRLDKGFIPMTKYKGTREYMSPQIIRLIVFKGQNYNYDAYKADIWALGVCLYRLLTAKYPFYLKMKTLSETKQMLKDQENKNWSYPKYLKIDPKVDDLLNRLLEPNEDNRIDWYAIRSHKWLEGETSLTHTDQN